MRYFHATYTDLAEKIEEEGLLPGWDGVVYLAETFEQASGFMGWRLLRRFEGTEDIEIDGKVHKFPKLETFENYTIFEVDLDMDTYKVEESFDHSPAFFGGARAWMTEKRIHPLDIVGRWTVTPQMEEAEAEV